MATRTESSTPSPTPTASASVPDSTRPPPAASPSGHSPASKDASKPVEQGTTTPALGLTDPLAALGSMWNGWMAPAPASTTPSATTTSTPLVERHANAGGESGVGSGAAGVGVGVTANEWLAGAGKLWESAVKDVGSKLKSAAEGVEAGALGEQVSVMRQRSGQFVEEVSKSVRDMNLSLDQTELAKRAEVLSAGTKELLGKASASLQQGRQEALEMFVDAGEGGETEGGRVNVAPWDAGALEEGERQYADALRQEMLRIVVDAIYSKKKRTELFLSGSDGGGGGDGDGDAGFDFGDKARMAMAALEADTNMRRLRAGLVPGKMREEAFWERYFGHVERVRRTLMENGGVMPEGKAMGEGGGGQAEEEEEDAEALFADDGEDEELAALDSPTLAKGVDKMVERESSRGMKGVEQGDAKRNWDDEIDAIFDDDEDGG